MIIMIKVNFFLLLRPQNLKNKKQKQKATIQHGVMTKNSV